MGKLIEELIDSECERLILGNILNRGGEFWRKVGPQLDEDCFSVEAHRRVFGLIQRISDAGREPNLSECYEMLKSLGTSIEGMGLPSLSALAWDDQVDLIPPEPWIARLRKKAAGRATWKFGEEMRQAAESGQAQEGLISAREALSRIEAQFKTRVAGPRTLGDAFTRIGVDNLMSEPRGMVPSPWERVNTLTNGGPLPGQLWLMASRQWAICAANHGHRVLFVSLEMSEKELLKRSVSSVGNIPFGLLMAGGLSREWRYRMAQTTALIEDYKLDIRCDLRTFSGIMAEIAAAPDIGLVVIDYLGLIESGLKRPENRNQEVSWISRKLKLAAMDYNVPILALHQLNRSSETESRRPMLSDLRDSGSLEQDADTVLLLDAPAQRKRADAPKEQVDLHIAKQRNGKRSETVTLWLDGRFCRMIEDRSEVGDA